jgi:hypothetical protein
MSRIKSGFGWQKEAVNVHLCHFSSVLLGSLFWIFPGKLFAWGYLDFPGKLFAWGYPLTSTTFCRISLCTRCESISKSVIYIYVTASTTRDSQQYPCSGKTYLLLQACCYCLKISKCEERLEFSLCLQLLNHLKVVCPVRLKP